MVFFVAAFGILTALSTGAVRAVDPALVKRAEEQQRLIDALQQRVVAAEASAGTSAGSTDEPAVKAIVADYLKDHPGAGMPSGVQAGYSASTGFAIKSGLDPKYANWEDESKIPFELRIRGRIQAAYYYYKVTDTINHQIGAINTPATGPGAVPGTGANTAPDFSQLELVRTRLFFEGTAFTPNLRYQLQIDGSTRGVPGIDARANFFNNPIGNVLGGQTVANVDHAMRIVTCFMAYDGHPTWGEKGCGCDCPEGCYKYTPTITAIIGRAKPMINLEEYLGYQNQQFVEYSMADFFFDADDDASQMLAGFQVKALDDRLFALAYVTNAYETLFPNLQQQQTPGVNLGGWYDFGGNWNADRKKWDLFGDCIADVDYSCKPVARVGGSVYYAPLDRRSQDTTILMDRVKAVSPTPGGTNLDSLLNGAGVGLASPGTTAALPNAVTPGTTSTIGSVAGTSAYSVDAFDAYTFDAYAAAKWRGLSVYNEWWVRDVNHFRGQKVGGLAGAPGDRPILFNSTLPGAPVALFTRGNLLDFGTAVQVGYFVVPKRLELAARWSRVEGQSGNVRGNGTFTTVAAARAGVVTVGGVAPPATIAVVNGAFSNFQSADELALGLNYYFRRQMLKWQTDVSFYNGGNPASNGQSLAGFIPGVDGWLLRTQIQLMF